MCASSFSSKTIPSTVCVYPQDSALCGLIAATNIHTISGKTMWSCTSLGVTSTNPCTWSGLTCVNNAVVSISIAGIGLSG